ncbi:MAG: TlpA family protein disulfide reductase [Betaproteobacteria bacterium]|jgi:thiol-disulfide isomerase/thioredoxin|nr:MAG: TlpA family protein disulfide reductase [Betaproteobacteria bacterium]
MIRALGISLFVGLALLAGIAGYRLTAPHGFSQVDASGVLKATLPDLEGVPQTISRWKGHVLVVNFWATWCPPCLEEIPVFVRLQRQMGGQGLQFLGIAIDERDRVVNFARRNGINYPIMIGQLDAIELSKTAGNQRGGLPYTLVLDRSGRVVSQHYGALTEQALVAIVAELL